MNSFIAIFMTPFVFWTSSDSDSARAGHSWITKQAIEIVTKDTKVFETPYLKESIQDIENLINGPDEFETTYYTWAGHFYDPDTELNWLGVNYNTALTNFIYHANLAIDLNNKDWVKNLAYSLHYLEDACVPHHAANYTVLNSNHKEFERFTQENQEKFKVSTNIYPYSFTSDFTPDLKKILRNCSIRAKMWVYSVVNSEANSDEWYKAAEYTIKESQYDVSLAIVRILKERFKDVY